MSSIIITAREFRADVLRGDKQMLSQLSSAYEQIARRLERELRELTREIEAARRAGKTVNRDWLRRSFRYQQLIRQAQAEINGFARYASPFIQSNQRSAIRLGQSHSADLIQAADVDLTFVRLPTSAIEELVGVLGDGSPLDDTLKKFGVEAASDIRKKLIEGLGAGKGPRSIAREISGAIDAPRWRALAIARTETMRAYRQSSLATYAENEDMVSGWTWISTQSVRTCAACWALHGTVFPLSKQFFPSHVSCRCTSIPNVRGVKSNVQSGTALFGQLPAAQQATILGPSRYEMFRAGTPLEDFVILTRDKDWGGAYQVRPLYKLKNRKKAA
jgi:SPP1 gp7 family putative phage head morphogenesis protein